MLKGLRVPLLCYKLWNSLEQQLRSWGRDVRAAGEAFVCMCRSTVGNDLFNKATEKMKPSYRVLL